MFFSVQSGQIFSSRIAIKGSSVQLKTTNFLYLYATIRG